MTAQISPKEKDNLSGICSILLTMSEDMVTGLNAGFNLGYQAGKKAKTNEKDDKE